MKNFNFLQIFGFTIEIFSFVALVISIISKSGSNSRVSLYLLFLVGVILVTVGNIIKRNHK